MTSHVSLPTPSISVTIITKNEATDLRHCLESVKWADEIIVLDSGSTDQTLAIAKEYTSQVYVNSDWKGFGYQKNLALSYATKDWVLSIDADEIITPSLKLEILSSIRAPSNNVYRIPRSSSFCGKFMKHSGWYPDYVDRLFKRGVATFSKDLVHERLQYEGSFGTLQHPLLHTTYHDLSEVLHKINLYSSLGAEQEIKKNQRFLILKAISHGFWRFFKTYILKAGFMDGAEGWMLAVSNAEATYYKYVKLYYLQKITSHSP
jgi:glycosyltransferase involved in cell wall biosynthesis